MVNQPDQTGSLAEMSWWVNLNWWNLQLDIDRTGIKCGSRLMSQCPVELCLASRINECTLGHFVDHELLEFEARVRISTYLSDVYFLGQGTMAMFFLQNIHYYIPWQQHRTSSSRSEVNLPVALGPPAQTCMSSSCELQVRPPEPRLPCLKIRYTPKLWPFSSADEPSVFLGTLF